MAPFDRSYALKSIRKFNIPYRYRGAWHRENHDAVKSQARAILKRSANSIKSKLQRRRWRRVIEAARYKKMQTRNFRRRGYVTSRAPSKKFRTSHRKVPWQVTARKRQRNWY